MPVAGVCARTYCEVRKVKKKRVKWKTYISPLEHYLYRLLSHIYHWTGTTTYTRREIIIAKRSMTLPNTLKPTKLDQNQTQQQ